MNKTIGILAHVDAGKTTFSEQLLYHARGIKERGRVDHKNAFMDSHEIEKQRGITVFADQAVFTYNDSTYFLLDTPGHVDFSPEMERAIQVMDYAIIIVSAVEGIEGHTETVWSLLRKHDIPVFFFINKTDRTGASVHDVMANIQEQFTDDLCDLTAHFHNRQMNEELIEFVAERDEDLLHTYLEHGYTLKIWLDKLRDLIQTGKTYPYAYGSALLDQGVKEFLEQFDLLTMTDYKRDEPFAGKVYKIRHDDHGTRLAFIKAMSGRVKVRDDIDYGNGESGKVTQILSIHGTKYEQQQTGNAGELFVVVGLAHAAVGDGVGSWKEKAHFEMVPTLRSNVVFEPHIHKKEALKYFRLLEAEDPSLQVVWVEKNQAIHLHVMGKIQLEILEQIIFQRFSLKVRFEEPDVIYKETIKDEVIGYRHFEPLRHYAEVHLRIVPGERNSGLTFSSECHTDDLTIGLQNLVGQHVLERKHHGILTGSALTDIRVTLLTGRAHNEHTHGGDFREATYRALRQGLEKASNQLLEPYYRFTISVQMEQMGRVLSDIQAASGQFEASVSEGEKTVITGIAPVATFMDYNQELASFTGGKGRINLRFAGYFPCHNEQEVIEKIGYDKNADPEYTSSSIFCAKGKGYSVDWKEAEDIMHGLRK